MTTEKRNYGVDLLRMLSMYFVIILHVLGQGGILGAFTGQTPSYATAWLLRSAAFCAVNCYALISGFVAHGRWKPARYLELWLQVVFYCAGTTLVFQLLLPDSVAPVDWLEAFLPVSSKQYWYFSAYTGLFFVMPLLNRAIRALDERSTWLSLYLLCALLLLNGTVGELFDCDVLNLNAGFSCFWLVLLYCLGAFLRKLELHRRVKHRAWLLIMALLLVFLSWGWKRAYSPLLSLLHREDLGGITGNWLITYTSPTIIGVAVLLLLFFAGKSDWGAPGNQIIRFAAPAAFGVYLLHVQQFVWDHLLADRFAFAAEQSAPVLCLIVLAAAAGIFVLGVFVDRIRGVVFALFHIRQGTEWVERQMFRLGDALLRRAGVHKDGAGVER